MTPSKFFELKRQEFKKYLESTGVMAAITAAIVCLYEEPYKPDDPLMYICKHLGTDDSGEELKAALARIAKLEAIIALLLEDAEPADR